jgi:hypothetical protein
MEVDPLEIVLFFLPGVIPFIGGRGYGAADVSHWTGHPSLKVDVIISCGARLRATGAHNSKSLQAVTNSGDKIPASYK